MIYLLCGNRPIAEILKPQFHDLGPVYERQFLGMSSVQVSLQELESVRERLVQDIHHLFSDKQKQFLMSFKKGEPNWGLLNRPAVEYLPAIQWKLQNIRKMPKQKHQAALNKLGNVLYA